MTDTNDIEVLRLHAKELRCGLNGLHPLEAAAQLRVAEAIESLSAGASGGGVPEELASLLCNAFDNLNDLPINDDWAYRWCRQFEKTDYGKRLVTPASPATGDSLPPFPDAAYMTQLGNEAWSREQVLEYGRQCLATPQPESARGEWHEGTGCVFCDLNTDHATECTAKGITNAAPQPQQAPAQADDAAEQYRQAHNAGEAHGRVMAALEAATPPAHGDGEADDGAWQVFRFKFFSRLTPDDRRFILEGLAGFKFDDRPLTHADEERILRSLRSRLTARPAPEADARDGARWRALVNSARIRVLGSAGLLTDTNPYGEPWNGYAHIGLELWTKHEAGHDPSDAVEWLTKYVDAAMSLPAQGREDS